MEKRSISIFTATSVVIANMIGTGVFTSLGYQVLGLHSGLSLMILWLLGGVASLLGALCYAEIGAALPQSGGEYNYLSRIYHPSLGFLSGWVSATVGFAAPIAAAAMAFAGYLKQGGVLGTILIGNTDITGMVTASILVVLISGVHFLKVSIGSRFQNVFTSVSLLTIVFIIVAGLMAGRSGNAGFGFSQGVWKDLLSPSFAVSFFFVSFAYSGWNAAAYIAGELDQVQKNLPKALLRGTAFVTLLYVLLNFVFLYTTPLEELAGQKEVGFLAATHIFGIIGGKIMAVVIAIKLISTVSSMTLAGPRIISAMGQDLPALKKLSQLNKHGVPAIAIGTQTAIALLFVLTASFEQVITFIGFTLTLFTLLTVVGLMVLRIKQPNLDRPFKVPFYPITPLLFIGINVWLLYFGISAKPLVSLAALGVVVSGLGVYFIGKGKSAN